MPSEYTNTFLVNCSATTAAIAIRDAIKARRYNLDGLNPQGQFLSASRRISEPAGRDKFEYDFQASASWDEDGSGIVIQLSILEESYYQIEDKCQEQWNFIADKTKQLADRYKTKQKNQPKRTTYGSARWATTDDLAKKKMLTNSVAPDTLLIGKIGDKYFTIPKEETNRHAIVCGPQGAGKSTAIFVPNILERPYTSMLVTEATSQSGIPDIYERTAGARYSMGHQIYAFNPLDMSSTRINPMDAVRAANTIGKRISYAQDLAHLIIANTSNPDSRADPIWDRAERHLLKSLILHVAAGPPKYANLATVRNLLTAGLKYLKPIFKNSPSPPGRSEFEAFMNLANERFARDVSIGLFSRLEPWGFPEVITLTAETDFRMSDLANNLFTFYLSVPGMRDDLKLVTVILFDYLMQTVLKLVHRQVPPRYPIALMLDEFTNFGQINRLYNAITLIRKTGLSMSLGFQDFGQLIDSYGENRGKVILRQPATRIFFRQNDHVIAQEISHKLGKETICEPKLLDGGKMDEREIGRDLLTPDEIIHLSEDQMIVFTSKTRQVLLDKFPYGKYESQRNIKPPKRQKHRIDMTSVGTANKLPVKPGKSNDDDRQRRSDKAKSKDRGKESRPPWMKGDRDTRSIFDDVPDVDIEIERDR